MKKTKLSKIAAVIAAGAACAAMGFAAVACGDGDDHTHKWDEAWTTSATEHWHACTVKGCTAKKDKHKHEDSETDDDTLCDTCGYEMGEEEGPGEETGDHTIALDKSTLDLSIDNLTYTLVPTLGVSTDNISWDVTAGDAVTVGTNGLVTAVKPGTATITASISEDVSATCEVTVATAYYIIGGADSNWTKSAGFGEANTVYLMPTEEGIYKTAKTELPKNSNFKIGIVGITDNSLWDGNNSYGSSALVQENNDLKAGTGGNILAETHATYIITLDTTGDSATIHGELIDDLSDQDGEDVYYLIGTVNGWTTIDDDADAEYLLTDDGDGNPTISDITLAANAKFKVAIVGNAYNGALDSNAVTVGSGYITSDSDNNIVIKAEGTYTIKVVDGKVQITSSDVEEPQELPYAAVITFKDGVQATIIFTLPQTWSLTESDLNSGTITIGGQEIQINSSDKVTFDASDIDVSGPVTVNGGFRQGGATWSVTQENVTIENGATYKLVFGNYTSESDGIKYASSSWEKL